MSFRRYSDQLHRRERADESELHISRTSNNRWTPCRSRSLMACTQLIRFPPAVLRRFRAGWRMRPRPSSSFCLSVVRSRSSMGPVCFGRGPSVIGRLHRRNLFITQSVSVCSRFFPCRAARWSAADRRIGRIQPGANPRCRSLHRLAALTFAQPAPIQPGRHLAYGKPPEGGLCLDLPVEIIRYVDGRFRQELRAVCLWLLSI